jgi:methyltransferase (TIGR00027 family)
MLRPLRPVHGLILGRSRYAEEKLEAAIRLGVSQYLIFGAGFDTYALRRASGFRTIEVFEIDHPASQSMKQDRLVGLGMPWPENLHFVPVDLEMHSIQEALARSKFDFTRRCFVAWLGTTFYLSHDAIKETLQAIAHIGLQGSELVFDYLVPERLVPPSKRSALAATRRFAAQRGEPILATYSPDEIAFLASLTGFMVSEDLSSEDLQFRYFSSRTDDLTSMPGSRLVHLRKL